MAANASIARPAGASSRSYSAHARALIVALSTFVIAFSTLGCTAGALFWGGLSLLGLGDTSSLAGGLIAVAATLPPSLWLAWCAHRIESASDFRWPVDGRDRGDRSAAP
jgi:hypothetical protein